MHSAGGEWPKRFAVTTQAHTAPAARPAGAWDGAFSLGFGKEYVANSRNWVTRAIPRRFSSRLRLFICVTLKFPRVPARVSEALVLRTYPLKEADLVVSFLSRDQGKLRGVARRARRPKSPFGAGLERLSHVRVAYFQRETRELVNLDSCELIRSQFGLVSDFEASVALDYFAEVAGELLPDAEPNERFFRLLLAVLDSLQPAVAGRLQNASEATGKVWRAVTYFSVWAVRLSGLLPELNVCLACGSLLDEERAFFNLGRSGLVCSHCRAGNSWELSAGSRFIAVEMLRQPVAQLSKTDWDQTTASDLRRFLVQQIESHVERRLITPPMLEMPG
jgi:DNA repair protein RecO (recombination protein O)